jgi:hypothetical protein
MMGEFWKTWKKQVGVDDFRKCHKLHQIETDGITLVTFKWWAKHKQRWVYESEPTYCIEIWMKEPKD